MDLNFRAGTYYIGSGPKKRCLPQMSSYRCNIRSTGVGSWDIGRRSARIETRHQCMRPMSHFPRATDKLMPTGISFDSAPSPRRCTRVRHRGGGDLRNTFMTTSSSTSITTHDVYWSLTELGDKMILDLGCMKTVAGTTWVKPLVLKWKRNGWYCKVVPEKESFRFGDGHINQSKFAVIIHVNLAGIPCLLRISVVAGNCPPLLSKPVCTTLGLMVDTSSHAVTSKKYGIKRFGLSQSAGGHYVIPIDQLSDMQPVPSEFSSAATTMKCFR